MRGAQQPCVTASDQVPDLRCLRAPSRSSSTARPKEFFSARVVANTARVSKVGHFASVALVSVDRDFARPDAPPRPLWRGHGMYVNYEGLE